MYMFAFNHPKLPVVHFSQDDVNNNSSEFNCEEKVPEFLSEDWLEAAVSHIFDLLTPEQVEILESEITAAEFKTAISVVA